MTERVIQISTRKYSIFVHRILDEYNSIIVYVDGAIYHDNDIPFLKNFCTNKQLKSTIDFLIVQDEKQLFGFHDHPSEFWANISELKFIEKLAAEKIAHYRICPVRPPFWKKIIGRLKNILSGFPPARE